MNDSQLIARYVRKGSQEAFAELVRRHLNFVYSAALRLVRAPQMAEDVTQIVFVNLARKASSISDKTILAGWLHRDTRYTALDMLRAEHRRQIREQEAAFMNTPDPDWEQVRPWLDEALDRMPPLDRDALLLRFFENRSLREIGAAIGSGEDAARKRVSRALDKLRQLLADRGVATTASALSQIIGSNGIHAAPASLAGAIVAASLAAGGATVTSFAPVHLLKSIPMAQFKTTVVGLVAIAGVATVAIQHFYGGKLRAENDILLQEYRRLAEVQSENESLSNRFANASSTLSAEQTKELLRLRGEVGRLRNDLRNKTVATHAEGEKLNEIEDRKSGPEDSSQAFTTQLIAQIGDGQTLVTGGWATNPGKRTFFLMTPAINNESSTASGLQPGEPFKESVEFEHSSSLSLKSAAKLEEPLKTSVRFETATVEIPESMLTQFGLDQLTSDNKDSSIQKVFTEADAGSLLRALDNPIEGVTVVHGIITTIEGRTTSVKTGQMSAGEPFNPGYTLALSPSVLDDRKTIRLSIDAQVQPREKCVLHQ